MKSMVMLRPNIKNLNLVPEPPKTGFNCAPAQIAKHWIQFQVEPIMFEPLLEFLNETSDYFFSEAEIKPRRWTAKNRFQLSSN